MPPAHLLTSQQHMRAILHEAVSRGRKKPTLQVCLDFRTLAAQAGLFIINLLSDTCNT